MPDSSSGLGHTERLNLRAPIADDLGQIIALWTDPQVTHFVGGPREPGPVEEYFLEYATDPAKIQQEYQDWWWTVEERSSGEIVGLCGLMNKEIDAQEDLELNYFLLPQHWQRGYATEASTLVVQHAFSNFQLETLIALIHPDNQASIAVARKLGFHLDRELVRPDGATKQLYRLNRQAAPGP